MQISQSKKNLEELQHPFPAIQKDRTVSYGGNQSWARQKFVQKSGCGVISGTDLLLYLHRYRKGCCTELFDQIFSVGSGDGHIRDDFDVSDCKVISLEMYNRCVDLLRRKYFPIIPRFGMNGLMLVFGLNRYFRKYHINLKASWCMSLKKLWQRMEHMLAADLPVIFAVGPNFPFIWRKKKLTFYQKRTDGSYIAACETNAHFITVTAMDQEWIRISSWGKEYYINKKEYENYVKKYSCSLVNNMVYLSRRRRQQPEEKQI